MEGDAAQFEAIGNRLGFRTREDDNYHLKLVWQGTRFPAFLCLGVALALLFISVPIVQAIQLRGFVGPASSLWYFPLMNLILFIIALFLFSLRRTVLWDDLGQKITFQKRSLLGSAQLSLDYSEVEKVHLRMDQVYSGFALAGSSAAENFPAPSLRLITASGATVLMDRGSVRRLKELGKRISDRLAKPLEIESGLG